MKTLMFLLLIFISFFTLISCEDDYVPELINYEPELIEKEDWAQIESTDIRTNYYVSGYSDATVDIIFIHGLATNHLSWLNQVEYFKTKARVININLPYVGSDYEYDLDQNWTFELLADAVYSVMEKENSKNAIVVGHSSGYAVAKELGIKYPSVVSKIINIDLLPFTWPAVGDPAREEFIAWRESFFLPALLTGALQEYFIESQCPTGITPPEIRDYALNCMQSIPKDLVYDLFFDLTSEEMWLPKPWNIPIISIHVAENTVGFANLTTLHPNISFEIVPVPSGHYIQMEHPSYTNQIINEFVFNNGDKSDISRNDMFENMLPTE